jgi:hypothetical protein
MDNVRHNTGKMNNLLPQTFRITHIHVKMNYTDGLESFHVQLRLSGMNRVDRWKLSNVSANTAIAIFRVQINSNICRNVE